MSMEKKVTAVETGVSRFSPLPLYVQIADYWRQRIMTGQINPGDQLPSESEMAKMHGVSRITIKQAVASLVHQGLIQTHQGKGTFAVPRKLQWDLARLSSFSEDMKIRNLRPGARLLRKELVKDNKLTSGGKEELCVCIERLRLANDEPMAIETTWLPYDLCAGLMDDNLEGVSIYLLLEERYGLKLVRADQYLESSVADRREADLLQIKENEPVLRIERLSYLDTGRPCEATWSVYRGDRYRFKVTLSR